jgi:hypothetical protein
VAEAQRIHDRESEDPMTWLCITYLRLEFVIVTLCIYTELIRHSDFPRAIVRR